jgi:hypothetical protein
MQPDNVLSEGGMAVPQQTRHHQRPQRRRYQPTAAYVLAERVKRKGVEIWAADGPWRAAGRPLRRPGRNHLGVIPLVTNGHTEVMVDTMEHAADLSGLLNWSGVDDLNPVSDLSPPPQDSLGGLH